MLEQLIAWDKSLFIFSNSFHTAYFDNFFWIFTQATTWIPLYLSLLFILIKTKKKDAIWIILGIAVTILLSDQISSGLIKPLVARLRPSHEPSLSAIIHLINGYQGGAFGFVSSHAANSFGLALFTSFLFRNKTFSVTIFCWAFVNSYSRIYVGVHYPLDIIGGALIGLLSAGLVYSQLKKYKPSIFIESRTEKSFFYSEKLILLTLTLIVLLIVAFAWIK